MAAPRDAGPLDDRALDPADRESERSAIDRLRRWGGDALVRELTAMFLADTPERLAAARAAAEAGDAARAAYWTHAMKSSSAQLGALGLARLCAESEQMASRGELSGIPAKLDQAELEFEQFRTWLRSVAPEVEARA